MAAPTDNLKIDGGRLWGSLMDMAKIGPGVAGGNNRQTLTDDDAAGRALFARWCDEAGLSLGVDTMGTMFATRAGEDPDALPVYVGSHLDTQPTGGKYDGVLGVLGALEAVRSMNDLGIRTRHPIVVTNWTNEEGARFAPAMLASGVFAGVSARTMPMPAPTRRGRPSAKSSSASGGKEARRSARGRCTPTSSSTSSRARSSSRGPRLTPEAAIGREHELVGRDVLERPPDPVGDDLGEVGLQRPVADDTDGDLLLERLLVRRKERELPQVVLGRLDRPDVALQSLQVDLDRVGVGLVAEHLLHVRISPAGVDPDLDVVETLDLAVEAVDEEVDQLRLLRVVARDEVQGRLLDLDHLAPRRRKLPQLEVHGLGHVPRQLLLVVEVVVVVVAVEEEREHLGRARAELDLLARSGALLRDPPDLRVLERIASGRARPCRRRAASARSCRSSRASSRRGRRGAASACSASAAPRARVPSSAGGDSGATIALRRPRRGGSRRS